MIAGFDAQPELEGERLALRPMRAGDREALYAAAADPAIWEQHPDRSRHERAGFDRYFDSGLASGAALVAVDRASGALIGCSRYHDYDALCREVEIGWTFLTRACWGGAWNADMKSLMLAHAFHYVDTVVFWVGEDNRRSRRAMEKIGARLRPGVHRRAEGGDAAHVVYEIGRKTWEDSPISGRR